MSVQDAERFANDLKAKPQMLAELKKTVGGKGLAAVCGFAKRKGYNVTVEEAKKYLRGKAKRELSDQQLDRVAGGKGPGGDNNMAVVMVGSTTGPVQAPAAIAVIAGPATAVVVIT
jgi:predicted ribosomally synthesized peptide with nif11-like leader